ncbi:uncharacterized protein LOC106660850 isoform X1 [Cimex lectularius]|uniref:Uncharacterized protein n=1 Tax=Cimex lectularius TaxID=79782 RepID=A0A8I6SSH8_CIMLE|nr:uncharacterized protein LOC106660850 isoform X1 [Cimex lectularius]
MTSVSGKADQQKRPSVQSGVRTFPRQFPSLIDDFMEGDFKFEEERDMLAFQVREMVFRRIIDTEYSKYIDSQVAPFTVHCFQMALKKLLNWNFQQKDLMDTPRDWDEDYEPPPCPIDSWASFGLPLAQKVTEPPYVSSSISVENPPEPAESELADQDTTMSGKDGKERKFRGSIAVPYMRQDHRPSRLSMSLKSTRSFTSHRQQRGSTCSLFQSKTTGSYLKNFTTFVRGLGNYIDPRKFPPPSTRSPKGAVDKGEYYKSGRKDGAE